MLESSNLSHLELSLRLQALLLPETVLLVLGVRLAVGSAFTIRALARTDDGGTFLREAVIELDGGSDQPFLVLEWRRGRLPLASG